MFSAINTESQKPLLSAYDLIMKELEDQGRVTKLNEEDSLVILKSFESEIEDFIQEHKKSENEAEQELSEIILNS